MSARLRIAHLTDLHFQRLATAKWSELIGKRAIGAFNLRILQRDREFSEAVVHDLVVRIQNLKPDYVAITGDLSALGLDSEFDAARDALLPVLSSIPSFVIPGNHDIYTPDARSRFEARFAPWMGEKTLSGLQTSTFGDFLFIGMDCCRPTLIGSRGFAPPQQLSNLVDILENTDKKVILLTHYPIVDSSGKPYHLEHHWHGIENGSALLSSLSESTVKPYMILHGHVHKGWATSWQDVAIHNPGAGGHAYIPGKRHSAFNIYNIETSRAVSTHFAHNGIDFLSYRDKVPAH
uniref:Calcineurin-like phosphoesterase domain-containing protein n=1 Tax=Spongospora subterranea TaxID=70186 RepID=A0A0H5RAT0_9EUKA|eukprot:CRZ11168.1 hypothetical protein [Spongospora subterranea]